MKPKRIERGQIIIATFPPTAAFTPMEPSEETIDLTVDEVWELMLTKAWTACQNNRELIESGEDSDWCGCFYCLGFFRSAHIKKWVGTTRDGRRIESGEGPGQTAICPLCGIDAVIPEKSGFLFADDDVFDRSMMWAMIFLRKMEKRYFKDQPRTERKT